MFIIKNLVSKEIDYLLISFIDCSRIFSINQNLSVVNMESQVGVIDLSHPTVAFQSFLSQYYIQVLSNNLLIIMDDKY